jgi:hypothetical protein
MVASLVQEIKNLKLQVIKNTAVFTFYFQTYYFQTAVTSKPMIEKGSGWSHSLHLIELLKIDSAELPQNNKTKLFLFLSAK